MGKSYDPQSAEGALIAPAIIYDTTLQNDLDVNSTEFKEFLVRMQEAIVEIVDGVNARDAGIYSLEELVNGQTYFQNPALTSTSDESPDIRTVFRLVIDFGALPNNTTKDALHGLDVTSGYTFTRIYAAASIPGTTFLPIPYATATAADVIELWADATKVYIKTGKDRTAYTACYVILEYIKQ